MLIILEGPDGSGKTTLAKRLREDIPEYLWTMSPSRPPKAREDILSFLSMIESRPRNLNFLFDRFPLISENIYGPVLRGSNLLSGYYDTIESISKWFHQHGQPGRFLIVYCRPYRRTVVENLVSERQLEGVPEKIDGLIDAYDDFMTSLRSASTGLSVYSHNYRDGKPAYDQLLSYINYLIRMPK